MEYKCRGHIDIILNVTEMKKKDFASQIKMPNGKIHYLTELKWNLVDCQIQEKQDYKCLFLWVQ